MTIRQADTPGNPPESQILPVVPDAARRPIVTHRPYMKFRVAPGGQFSGRARSRPRKCGFSVVEVCRVLLGLAFGLALAVRPAGAAEVSRVNSAP